ALTLNGQGQAEIRGSQIWTGWAASGARWVSNNTVPSLPTFQDGGRCLSGTDNRCLKAEQVFLNGQPLTQVSANPVVGQFALDGSRHVILADDPASRTVEVTTRNRWINFNADGVTIQGFIMKHSGNEAQQGGMTIRSHSSIIIRNNVLSDAHGAVVSMGDGLGSPGTDCQLLNNDIFRGGELGVHGGGLRNQIIGNKIHNNNTEKFAYGWEAGGFKAAYDRDGIWDGNESYDNDGPGLWCDINCTNLTVRNNRVYRNKAGIFSEISTG
ncbi:MAG: right-handed parallel beta-helix repeat-containing protein, partial [Pyrinomonadaceae bacterium]